MKKPYVVLLLLLVAAFSFVSAPGYVLAEGNPQAPTPANRFTDHVPPPTFPEKVVSVCVPNNSSPKAYGFLVEGNATSTVGFLNPGLYSRIEYYSVTPNELGNLPKLDDETTKAALSKVVEEAHRHLSKVDLVVSNNVWSVGTSTRIVMSGNLEGRGGDPGLKLEKSYVVLNLIDEIVKAVENNNLDGVTIDFALPPDITTQESYLFLLDSLKTRLGKDVQVNAIYNPAPEPDSGPQFAPAKLTEFVDILFVFVDEGENIQPVDRVPKKTILARMLSNEKPLPSELSSVAVWNISGQAAMALQGQLGKAIHPDKSKDNLKFSRLICPTLSDEGDHILMAFNFLGIALAVYLFLSWMFYDRGDWPSKRIRTLIRFGLPVAWFLLLVLIAVLSLGMSFSSLGWPQFSTDKPPLYLMYVYLMYVVYAVLLAEISYGAYLLYSDYRKAGFP